MIEVKMNDSLRVSYEKFFSIGVAMNSWQTEDKAYSEFICRHFNSITAENEMKPASIMEREKTIELGDGINTVQNYEKVDKILSFARDNGLHVRYHVLCWHNQTPLWFFTKNWINIDKNELMDHKADLASREEMLARQDAYIRDVMTHVNTKFPGVVYCWDVVNEAIEPDQGAEGCYRINSPWYQVLGEEFVISAFRCAKKYKAPEQLLLYNDYNCYQSEKLEAILGLLRKLKDEDLVDGMGMQAHLLLEWPSIEDCERAARAYSELGLILQITELDIHCTDGSEMGMKALADRYASYFKLLVQLKNEGIDVNNVTLWGVTDKDSWIPAFRKSESHPLLFDAEKKPKAAYYSVMEVPEHSMKKKSGE